MSGADNTWRLILDGAATGAWNMAVDEALLEEYVATSAPPTLRFYSWDPPTISLGRGQTPHRSARLPVVRRPTGGQAVLHQSERTYSVTGRLRESPFTGKVLETYLSIAQALRTGLRRLAIDARIVEPELAARGAGESGDSCFQRSSSYEIAVGGRKLVGSAQLRRGAAFLQHGSILLDVDTEAHRREWGVEPGDARVVGLAELLGGAIPDGDALDVALAESFSRRFGVRLRPGGLTKAETVRAQRLMRAKYLSDAWNRFGRPTRRARAVSS